MNLQQKLELKKLLVPELKQSLEILCLPLPDLAQMLNEELSNNPFLEESSIAPAVRQSRNSVSRAPITASMNAGEDEFDPISQLSKAPSLQEVLLRQLTPLALSSEDTLIAHDIIGNINDDGFFAGCIDDIATTHKTTTDHIYLVLKHVQSFEPLGVGARDIKECLIIQCMAKGEKNPVLLAMIRDHFEDVARKKYSVIAKALGVSQEEVETCVKKISSLNPRPGQNYTVDTNHAIIPDIYLDEKEGDVEIFINHENIPTLYINEEYRKILKDEALPESEKEYLKEELKKAMELLRAISRRQNTLRRVLEVIVSFQKDAILNGLSNLKPLTCKEIAEKIEMHESTVYRVIMNKYAETPQGLIALSKFLTNTLPQENGEVVTSNCCKDRIFELIENEDKKKPLSDEDLAEILMKENGIKIARRTVAKYREELKILSSSLRRTR